MTEYDYSPAAYEKYQTTLKGVDAWRQNVPKNPSNPFKPSPSVPSKPLPQERERGHRRKTKSPTRSHSPTASALSSTTTLVKPLKRSHTTKDIRPGPERPNKTRSKTIPHLKRDDQKLVSSASSREGDGDPTPSRSHHRTKSSHHAHRGHSFSTSHIHRDGTNTLVVQLGDDSRNKVVHLPPPPNGEKYVIIPPPGTDVKLVDPHGRPIRLEGNRTKTPVQRKEKPGPSLYKRIIEYLSRSSASHHGSRPGRHGRRASI